MGMDLQGRHALVTGGGSGIGRAVARAFVANGASVTIVGRTESRLAATVDAGDAHRFIVADVTDEAKLAARITKLTTEAGSVDILVANAGAAESAPFLKSDAALYRRMLDINLMGVVNASRAVLPSMIARKQGRIIAVASIAGLKGYAYVSAYTAAKHAVVGWCRAVALETASSGVTINAICPGYTRTDLVEQGIDIITAKTGRSREEALAEILKDSPLKRLIAPEEVAAAALWLASDAGGAVTGAAIPVTGGEV